MVKIHFGKHGYISHSTGPWKDHKYLRKEGKNKYIYANGVVKYSEGGPHPKTQGKRKANAEKTNEPSTPASLSRSTPPRTIEDKRGKKNNIDLEAKREAKEPDPEKVNKAMSVLNAFHSDKNIKMNDEVRNAINYLHSLDDDNPYKKRMYKMIAREKDLVDELKFKDEIASYEKKKKDKADKEAERSRKAAEREAKKKAREEEKARKEAERAAKKRSSGKRKSSTKKKKSSGDAKTPSRRTPNVNTMKFMKIKEY